MVIAKKAKDLLGGGIVSIGNLGSPITEFIRQNPIVTGGIIAAGLGGTAAVVAGVRKRRKTKARARAPRRRMKRRTTRRRRRVNLQPRKHKTRRTHVHRRKGLDIVHKGKKRGISLKAIRASIASPRTPAPLKRGLRKLLRRRTR